MIFIKYLPEMGTTGTTDNSKEK